MVSKQKGIFDEPVKVRPQKHQPKTEEVVDFEDSIFALKKKDKIVVHSESLVSKEDFISIDDTIFCQKTIYKEENDEDNEDTKFLIHEDEVPLEESIFAKKKKGVSSDFKIPHKEKKVDLEEIFNRYKDLYISEYISNTKRLIMIDANIFNNCCVLLEESRKTKVMNIESYDLVKRVIKSSCTCVGDVFYSYTNMNMTLLRLISEMNSDMDTFTMYNVLDRSYIEVIDELSNNKKVT